jgi:hypothetical protein
VPGTPDSLEDRPPGDPATYRLKPLGHARGPLPAAPRTELAGCAPGTTSGPARKGGTTSVGMWSAGSSYPVPMWAGSCSTASSPRA